MSWTFGEIVAWVPGASLHKDRLDRILSNDGICSDNRHLQSERLGNEQPVKWISVQERQRGDGESMTVLNGQRHGANGTKAARYVRTRRRNQEFRASILNDSQMLTNSLGLSKQPKKYVRIQEKLHYSKEFRNSSSRGASKSSGTTNFPRSRP